MSGLDLSIFDVKLSDEQIACKNAVKNFLRDSSEQVFVIHGLAGTGKSFLLGALAWDYEDHADLCAFTGKAASNLARKTGLVASTIHSLVYIYRGKYIDDRGKEKLNFEDAENDYRHRTMMVDECSMINAWMARDMRGTGAKIIATGDPGQLWPIEGEQYFNNPDFVLRQVHRQAWDSAIIRQAHAVRHDQPYESDGPDFQVISHVTHEAMVEAGIILCWKNDTRKMLNAAKRRHLYIDGDPQPGEPVMCCKNNHNVKVLNGAIYKCLSFYRTRDNGIRLTIQNEENKIITLSRIWFEGIDETLSGFDDAIEFRFGYAATVHKFQGSEEDNVLLIDEYTRYEQRSNWVYTAITRAKRSIKVAHG